MYLKRLELQGFKSFAPRTVLEFSPGITAIVGPNGSGKSNVADAIRWVLGEQSMRQLRGKKSDDIIFAGGQNRAPMQMAEVTLVLDNIAGWLPSEHSEVAGARRSFRSGESEYLVSGQRVRLRDLLLLLAQARIGHDSYTVIGQGLVDQALSLRAEERRGLFEDAAGIRQFQAQRSDAEQKLSLTQTNLSRLRDILGEIEPRLGPLAEQARRAREYLGARGDLRRQLRAWYTWQWADLEDTRDRTGAEEAEAANHIETIRAGLLDDDLRLQQTRQARDDMASQIAALRRTRGEISGRAQTLERDVAVGLERRASLERQTADLESEQGAQNETLHATREHRGNLEHQLAEIDVQSAELARALDTAESEQHGARREQERDEARLRAAQREVIQTQARLGAAQTELGRLQKQLGERNRTLATRREALTTAQHRRDAARTARERQQGSFEQVRADMEARVTRRETLLRELVDGQALVEQHRAAVADAKRERRALADRLALLEEWQRDLDGYSAGARAILHAPVIDRPPVRDVLARLIRVTEGYEAAIEGALGPFLHALVADSADDAFACARWLRDRAAGHALIVWPPTASKQSDHGRPVASARSSELEPAAAFVETTPELWPLIAQLLNGVAMVHDPETAHRQWHSWQNASDGHSAPVSALVTPGGELFHRAGWLRGGAITEAGSQTGQVMEQTLSSGARGDTLLARERELRTLPEQLSRQDAAIASLDAQHASAVTAHAERQTAAAASEQQARDVEARAQELARELAALQRDEERAMSECQLSEAVMEQVAGEVDGLEQEVAATTVRVSEQGVRQSEALEAAHEVEVALDELQAANRTQQEALSQLRTTRAVQQQEAKALAQRLEQARTQEHELDQQVERRRERLRAIQVQQQEVDDTATQQREAVDDARSRLRELTLELGEREAALAHAEGTLAQVDREQALARQELNNVELDYRRRMVEAQRARDALDALAVQIRDELIELDELSVDSTIEEVATLFGTQRQDDMDAEERLKPEDAARARRHIDQLRGRMRQLGGYDPDAPQAYEELKTRHEFLSGQVRDMDQGATNLRAIIVELDATMRRQFTETFAAVNLRFQRHFTTLFSGGSARLELTAPRRQAADDEDDEDHDAEASGAPKSPSFGGVEVFVQIPGKRVQDLALLSGGERAMVSAALLFALLETNPPPFCLLDEVDAALDEANVVRFCEILKQLAENTQFIVITHNRVTMTHAGAIYGVSMGADSVSRVLSMRLADVPVTR